jgi:hypothetical protein
MEVLDVGHKPNKAVATDADVHAFLATLDNEQRHRDAHLLVELMQDVTGKPPVLWGTFMVGFGSRRYRYESGREGDTVAVGFAPRKAHSALHLTVPIADYVDLLDRLGEHRVGIEHQVGIFCVFLKHVDEADEQALRAIVDLSYRKATG